VVFLELETTRERANSPRQATRRFAGARLSGQSRWADEEVGLRE
jgi:hypothetical protein